MLAPAGCRSSARSVSSFDVPATLAVLACAVLLALFAFVDVLLMSVPFDCGATGRRYRHEPASRAETPMLGTPALSTGKWG